MRVLPTAQDAPKSRSRLGVGAATVLALFYVVIVVAQLFTFEDFHSVVASYWLPVSTPATHLIAALIVTAEVFSLPFLLRIRLSPAMRWFSMFLGWLVALWWLFISVWLLTTINAVDNSGLLGATVDVQPGAVPLTIALSMVVLAILAARGQWPAASQVKHKK